MSAANAIDFHLFSESLLRVIEVRDRYTAGHSRRVSRMAGQLGQEWGLSARDRAFLRAVGHVHDIGKIGITDGILMKSGHLYPSEILLMQQHPQIGASIFANLPGLHKMGVIIRHHHERFDGKGYPDGLKGKAIPVESAILAVADAFDAMTSHRPYKPALNLEQAHDEIRRNRGTQFHPDVCDLFLGLLARHPEQGNIRPPPATGMEARLASDHLLHGAANRPHSPAEPTAAASVPVP